MNENEAIRKRSPEWAGESGAIRKRWRDSIDLPGVRACARIVGDHTRAFSLPRLLIKFRISSVVTEYQLPNITAFPVDENIFESAPLEDADLFHTDTIRCVFKKDENMSTWPKMRSDVSL